ncbi:MAG: hypothetical protein AABZ47_11175, partial [Planctomycetota bacterium]
MRRRFASHRRSVSVWAAILFLILAAQSSKGQWVQQQFPLLPGLNAVFLEVDPAVENADLLWAGLPFSSVWTFQNQSNAAGPPRDCFDPNDPA